MTDEGDEALRAAVEIAEPFVRTMRTVGPDVQMPILKTELMNGTKVEVRRDAQTIDVMIQLRR